MNKHPVVAAAVLIATTPVMAHPLPIHFKQGDVCWTYTGPKTEFVGKFGPFQFVTVNAFAVSPGQFGGAEITNAEVSFTSDQRSETGSNFAIGDEGQINLVVHLNYNSPGDDHRNHVTHILICTSGVE